MSESPRRARQALAIGVGAAALIAGAVVIAGPAAAAPPHMTGQAVKTVSTAAAKRAAVQRLTSARTIQAQVRPAVAPNVIGRLATADRSTDEAPADTSPAATTTPTLGPLGTSGLISLTATSQAAFVLFEVDGAAVDGQTTPTPVAVSQGSAAATYSTWGTANGVTHTVTAADCDTVDPTSCDTADAASGQFTVTNDAPVITLPADGASVTGGFTIIATSAGGGIQFLIDGVVKGFDASSPYALTYTGSALSSGQHSISVVQCSVDEASCDGPESSISITSNSLHPALSAPTPAVFSPNGDGYKDSTKVTYTLPDTETATISVINSAGSTERSASLGTHSGKHTWTWNGRSKSNKVVPSGRYTIRLSTSAVRNGVKVLGSVSRAVTVDLRAPSLTSLSYPTAIYPRHDGYKDTFPVSFKTNETTAATLVILTSHRKVVRTTSATHAKGKMTLTWTGRDTHSRMVAAGTYGWYLSWHDSAGNKKHTATRHLVVSLRELVTKKATINKNGNSFWAAGGSDPSCAAASTKLSQYKNGVWLENACDYSTDNLQFASAFYHVALPSAVTYSSVRVQAGGFSQYPPTTMSVAYGLRGGSASFGFGERYRIPNDDAGYWGIGSANPTGFTTANHVMDLGVNVDDIDGAGDFDIATLRIIVTYKVLN